MSFKQVNSVPVSGQSAVSLSPYVPTWSSTQCSWVGELLPPACPGDSTDAQLCSPLSGLVQTQWVLIHTPSLRVCCRVIQPPVGQGGFIHQDV